MQPDITKTNSSIWIVGLWLILVIIFTGLAPGAAAAPMMAAAASQNSITLSWTAPGDDGASGTSAGYSIRYSTAIISNSNWNQATAVATPPTPQVAGSSEQFEVPDLTAGTEYFFAIKSVDESDNWSAISNVVNATTDPETIAPAIVADLSVSVSGSTSLTLAWTAPGDDDNSGTATTYDLRYSESPITVSNFAAATQIAGLSAPQVAGSSESIEVTELASSVTYYFAIKTADEVPNWSGISNIASGSTSNEIIPPAVIADLTAQSPTETTIELVWTAPGDDDNTGQASSYDIRFSTAPITTSNWASATLVTGEPAPSTAGSAESFTITGLASATLYYFAIVTSDDIPNLSGLSNVANLSTGADETPPAAIGDLTIVVAIE